MKINADAAGMDAARLERITEHLQRRYLDPGKIAGAQVAVHRRGSLAYFRSLGLADAERSAPVVEDTVWRIYSMTKPVTGVALMTLYERGCFQLTDPVHRFLPQWRDLQVLERDPDGTARLVPPRSPMTVRDLLMHTSGLGYDQAFDRTGTLETMIDAVAARGQLAFHPGTRWLYGISTDVCGRLVEVLSGERFDAYLQREVFDPLGMHDTGFVVRPDQVSRFAANYRRRPDKTLELIDDPRSSTALQTPTFLSGGGGLVSTTADYLRFARMLLGRGELDGVRILGPKTVELMTLNHLPGGGELAGFAVPGGYGEVGFAGMGFGLTMAVSTGPAQTGAIGSAGEYMWGGAASTLFWVDPAQELVVVFMTQLMPSGTFNFRGQLKALVYPTILDA